MPVTGESGRLSHKAGAGTYLDVKCYDQRLLCILTAQVGKAMGQVLPVVGDCIPVTGASGWRLHRVQDSPGC